MSSSIASSSTTAAVQRRFGSSAQIRINRPCSVSFRAKPVVCKAISSSAVPAIRTPKTPEKGTAKLEYWMNESVAEIVKKLGSGDTSRPLLVQVYGGGRSLNLRTERADASEWGRIQERWRSGGEASPEGIIVVEELKDEEEVIEAEEGSLVKLGEVKGRKGGSSSTKFWGVVLMGRGEEGGVASFLLKTTSCGASGGLFSNCVYYTLIKVKSFRESARSQFINFWLVQPP